MGEAKRKKDLLMAAVAELETCQTITPFELPTVDAFMLCSMLQLGLRHPDVEPNAPIARISRGFIRAFSDSLPPEYAAMRTLLAMGDDKRFDEPINLAPAVAADPNQKCRVCGCTEERACLGGCFWVETDLCSACSPAVKSLILPGQ